MKKHIKIRASSGFTLIEILVALLITAMLMATIASVFLMAQKIYIRGGDISYKQKSITNIETELQNSLGRAMKVAIITRAPESTDDYDYYIGFDATGKCNIGSDGYFLDQVADIQLEVISDTMSYKLIPKNNTMSVLSGGIVLNNYKHPDFEDGEFVDGSLNQDLPRYLVVTFATP